MSAARVSLTNARKTLSVKQTGGGNKIAHNEYQEERDIDPFFCIQ